MSTLTAREESFLSSIQEWIGSGNNEVYLAGSTRGPIDLNEAEQKFEIREDQALSENLVDALLESGVKDARVTGAQTLDLMNEMASEDFAGALRSAANDTIDEYDDMDAAPGMR